MKYDASSIKVLEGLAAVRERPSMFVGNINEEGLQHLVEEILDNSMDEVLAGRCTQIKIDFNKDGSCSISDLGAGIPVGIHSSGVSALEVVLTVLHSGGKMDDESYSISSGLNGLGVSIVNALSSEFHIISYNEKQYGTQSYKKGISQGPVKIKKNTKGLRGTHITFLPDPTIFTTVDFDQEKIRNRVQELVFLNPEVEILFNDEKINKTTCEYISSLVNETPIVCKIEPIQDRSVEGVDLEIHLNWCNTYSENIISFVNNVKTIHHGAHVNGFKSGVQKVFNELLNIKDDLTWLDIAEGLIAIVIVKMKNPLFENQTKTKLGNKEVNKIVENIVIQRLPQMLDQTSLKKIKDKILLSIRARKASKKAREHVRLKTKVDNLQLAGKLSDCQSKDPRERELFLVEGSSAAGTAKMGRNRRFQAILPLRGKILNVEKAPFATLMKNEEIQQIIAALGTGIGKDFNIRKLQYHKIIALFDSDFDGSHILTLFLTLIYRQLPELLIRGHIYRANPPLFGIKKGNTIIRYIQDDKELAKYKKKLPKGAIIQRYKGLGEMNFNQLSETALNPSTRSIQQITLGDIEQTDILFETLMGHDVQKRKEYIERNCDGFRVDHLY